jgi:lipopolysaccharide/colanic/teichoic acid biosynthesis glycosyltransferase
MRAILDRERMRSDRGNSTFALLTLTLTTSHCKRDLAVLASVVRDRIRATDDAGLLRPRVVGVLLPETPAEGAWTLAESLCALLPVGVQRPLCAVYQYPNSPSNHKHVNGAEDGASIDGDFAARPRRRDERCGAQPMDALFASPLPTWKRAMDVVGAAIGIALLAPLLLLVAAAIKLTSRGPVVFRQRRDTIGGRQFTIYKFRTMSVDAESKKAGLMSLNEQDGPAFKIVNDPRITRVGRFLRKTSIDELPQLFNVLMGDMTLVGPRAMDSNESRRCEPWQRRRLDVTAGITCIWQVRGRSAVSFAEWMRMDLSYVRSRSLLTDLKLIAQTVPAVLLRRGAC